MKAPCILRVGVRAAALFACTGALAQTAPAGPTASAQLDTLQSTLQSAVDSLSKASTDNKGGYVEQAIADLKITISEVNKSHDYLSAHPRDNELPAQEANMTQAIGNMFAKDLPTDNKRAPNLRKALADLKTAYDLLLQIPGGGFGGHRDWIMEGIGKSAHDVISGINFVPGEKPATPKN